MPGMILQAISRDNFLPVCPLVGSPPSHLFRATIPITILAQQHERSTVFVQSQQSDAARYESKLDRIKRKGISDTRAAQDIGDIPAVANPERRKKAWESFQFFCETYFAGTFVLAWSEDHRRVIAIIERCIIEGGLFALAMPRGSGKSCLCEAACLWAILTGRHPFVVLIGASETAAIETLDSIKSELECNDLLLEDFPEAVYPIQCLEGSTRRCEGQRHHGERTHITWTEREIVFPTIPDSPASGAVFRVAGITGRIRGMKHKRPDGSTIRPSLVIPDDPQTEESAHSVSQCETRERTIAGAVLGLAGPGKKISAIMPLTVIVQNDMADRMLSKDSHPDWQGERTKTVYEWPVNQDLWDRYAVVRNESLRAGHGIADATEFYRQNREAMDEGAVVAWPERYEPGEESAIQSAWNLRLKDERAFWAERQNQPLPEVDDSKELTADQIASKLSGLDCGIVRLERTKLTGFIDVHAEILFWAVCAWSEEFDGEVVAYGTWPEQPSDYFQQSDPPVTLATKYPGHGPDARILAGLKELTANILGKPWDRQGGLQMQVDRCLVDANWGQTTDLVYAFCANSEYKTILRPSHGMGKTASSIPVNERKRDPGEWRGDNCYEKKNDGRIIRHIGFDSNHWKTAVVKRLATKDGDSGCLAIFGNDPRAHRMFADHMTSEYRTPTEGRGRKVDVWTLRISRDNHWWDCIVGCAVGANREGCKIVETVSATPRNAPRKSLAELAGAKRK